MIPKYSKKEYVSRLDPQDERFAEALLSISGSHSQKMLHQRVVELLHGRITGGLVLEAGCGNGSFTKKLLAERPFCVVAADINPRALSTIRTIENSPLQVIALDLRLPLPFETASFNFLFCSSVLMHLSPQDSESAIKEFGRVLQPGAKFLIAVIHEEFAENEYQEAENFGASARRIESQVASRSADLTDERKFSAQLIEFYPEVSHYRSSLHAANLDFKEEVVYSEGPGEPQSLWRIFTNFTL